MLYGARARLVTVPPRRPDDASANEWRRYLLRLKAWFSGEILRVVVQTVEACVEDRRVVEWYPMPAVCARYDEATSAHRVSDQMDGVIRFLDAERDIYVPLRAVIAEMHVTRPQVLSALWRKHILLQTVDEVATAEGWSARKVQYLLAYGNGTLFTAYCRAAHADGRLRHMSAKLGSVLQRLESHLGEELNADGWHEGEEDAIALA